jgi:hypothetical protein
VVPEAIVTWMRDHGGLNHRETMACVLEEQPANSDALNLRHTGEGFSVLQNDLGSSARSALGYEVA